MPPVLASGRDKMPRKWFDYNPDRIASEEQRAWLRASQFGPPSRQTSLDAFSGLLDQNNSHANPAAHNGPHGHNPYHESNHRQTNGRPSHGPSGQHNSSLDNAVEDLLNNHLLSRAQRSESLASTSNDFCPISGRMLSKPFPNRLPSNQSNGRLNPNAMNPNGAGRLSAGQMNVGRTPSIAGRLSSIGSMDLNPISERMSSIGSLGDVTELINAANATSVPRPGNIPPTSHPSSESALLYMEMLKNGYGPLFRESSVPIPNEDPAKQQQQASAAELLMRHRLISLEPAVRSSDERGRVPPNFENMANRMLQNEKENSLIASTMASMIENNNSSSTTKSVMDRMSSHLHHNRDVDRARNKNQNLGHDDRGYNTKRKQYDSEPPQPYGIKPDTYGSSAEQYRTHHSDSYAIKPNDPHARSSPTRRPVQPRRFLSLGDIPDDRNIPHDLSRSRSQTERSQTEGSRMALDRPSYGGVKQEEYQRVSEDVYRRANGGSQQQRSDEPSCSTAEASRSTAELLIQLNQGKLSSRPPSDASAKLWNSNNNNQDGRDGSFDRGNDPTRRSGGHSRAGSPSQTSRRSLQPRSFLSSGYVQDVGGGGGGGDSKTGSVNSRYASDSIGGEKRSMNDMMVPSPPPQDDKSKNIKDEPSPNDGKFDNAKSDNPALKRFKPYHEDKWMENFQQLLKYKEEHGNCLVPHTYLPNPLLARWVKRQRRQYKLCLEKCPQSTMTPERVEILNKEGFVWDSHEITWMKKFYDLLDYRKVHGHCRVPSCSKEHPQLATWVKCQRRQYRLKREGKSSAMTTQRIKLLDDVGFSWEVRFAVPTAA